MRTLLKANLSNLLLKGKTPHIFRHQFQAIHRTKVE